MLANLRIAGFAVVDQVDVRFGPGLNVLTGETGAGKSLLVNALHLVLGGRMSAEVLREGAEEASVEALFELPEGSPVLARLAGAGVPPPEGGELLVRRAVSRSGRGRAFVNGSLVTVAMLEQALRGLVDLSGQHEHVSLLDAGTHLSLLDAFGGAAGAGGLAARYREAWEGLSARVREREGLLQAEGERAQRADYLAFQLRELEEADPRPGEDLELEAERKVLGASEKLREAARAAEGLVYGDEGSASERLGRALRSLTEAAVTDPRLAGPAGLLRSAAAEAEEAGRELARYAEALDGDPERLGQVEERLELLRRLWRKHGGSLPAALARRDAMRAELAACTGGGERAAELAREIDGEWAPRAVALAAELSAARREAAARFARAAERELSSLAMGRCRLEVALPAAEGGVEAGGQRLGPDGAERAEFLLAPNPGEPPRPLARIASGGELSRVLLAVKRALMRTDPVPTYVFDEVDAGIGGAVAEAVGRLLSEVSRQRQVLCVTHLPQVAAFADLHFRVEKRVAGGRTSAQVARLDEEERRQEVARMLAGQTVTASALEHAGALLAAARAPGTARGRRAAPSRAAARQVGR